MPERIERLLEVFPKALENLKKDIEKFVNEMESIIGEE
ncbi:hypothetical protein EV203_10420 [Caldanaerobacter subterraneus]|uniref:Uncharacterized protein n=1 Tax=Caldanaerobacter subterraneus TaxID=911092 RepID=A0A4R2K7S5_9THEO|nr:hypothetical protein EV203_10420 [Caldanaerobacter subterraneus]